MTVSIPTATHAQLRSAGFTVVRLRPSGPRRSDLVLTQTKGTRTRTNRGHGGTIPSGI